MVKPTDRQDATIIDSSLASYCLLNKKSAKRSTDTFVTKPNTTRNFHSKMNSANCANVMESKLTKDMFGIDYVYEISRRTNCRTFGPRMTVWTFFPGLRPGLDKRLALRAEKRVQNTCSKSTSSFPIDRPLTNTGEVNRLEIEPWISRVLQTT